MSAFDPIKPIKMPLNGIDLLHRMGHPKDVAAQLIMWDVPTELEIGVIPKRLYCHPKIVEPLKLAFKALIERGFVGELKTWDGCYNFRPIRGYEAKYTKALADNNLELSVKYLSIHSWGVAVDVNAFENGLKQQPKLTHGFVQCFKDAGFDWGGDWKRLDGMHFQLSNV